MKTIMISSRYRFTAFLFLLFFGATAAFASSIYEDHDCTYTNVFTLKVTTIHNNNPCTKKSESLPHYFTGISALIIHDDIRKKLLEKSNITPDNLDLFHADIRNSAAVLDIPLVSAALHEFLDTEYKNPNIEDFYLLICLHHKLYGSGSSQQIVNENFNNTSQWSLFTSNHVPIDGYIPFSPSSPILIKLTDLLSNKLTAQSQNPACERIEISLETKCKLTISQQSTIYKGYPYQISLSANASCLTNTLTATPDEYTASRDFAYTSGLFRWQYTHGDTNTYIPLSNKGKTITVSPTENLRLPIGKNILVRVIDGRSSNTDNTQVICFYPDLPQPTRTKFQRIPDISTYLDVLRLTFNRNFNKELDEKPTLITVYSKVAQNADGSISSGESSVLFQEAFDMAKLNGTTYTTSVAGRKMKEGTYYVTVEGTVRNQSNNPAKNGTLPNSVKNAMFKVVSFNVGKNDFEVEKVEFTPPACFGKKGKLKVTLNEYFIPLVSKYPVFFYMKNPAGLKGQPIYDTIYFRCTYTGTQANPHATFECDQIEAQHSMFKIVIPSLTSSGSTDKDPGVSKNQDKGTLPNTTYDRVSHFSITFSQPDPLRVPVEVKHLSGYYCQNGNLTMADDGEVTVFRSLAEGGTTPYSFFFRDDYLNPSQTVLNTDLIPAPHAGRRYITLKDKNACRFDTSVFVSNLNTELCAQISVDRDISCHNANDGILHVSLKKQSGNLLRYAWYKNGTLLQNETGTSLYKLGPGTYKVTVTDMVTGLCSSDEVSLTQPTQLKLTLQQKTDVDCFGSHSGTIALSGSGGTPSYLYLWNGISYGSSRRNLPAGDYEVKLIDHNSCEITQTYTITQPLSAFEISIDSVIHAHYNANDEFVPGKILQHPEGGTKPYGLLNSGGADLNRLGDGTYLLQQYDANKCMDQKEVSIEVYDRMRVSIVQDSHNLCFSDSKAACHAVIEGGVPPFNILWSNGKREAFINNLPAGNYSVRVQDAVNVVRTAEITIGQPERLQIDSLYVHNPTYHGCTDSLCPPNEKDGEIHFDITGGTAPYILYWKKNDTSIALYGNNRAEHLSAGNYLLETHDANGCTALRNFTLVDIAPLRIETDILQAINCHGDTSGILKATASGGTPPYRYAWNGMSAEGDIASNLPSGAYTATVFDALGVKAQASLSMPQPEPLRIRVDSILPPSYPGSRNGIELERENNGMIQLYVSGGTSPYRFEWYRNEVALENSSPHLSELSDGLYRLHLTDDAGCATDTTFNFPRIEALLCSISIERTVSCHGMSDAVLAACIYGGEPPYSITWIADNSDTVGSESILSNRQSGKYTLHISDGNGVESFSETFLSQPDSLQVHMETRASLCHHDSSGKASAIVKGGTRPYRYHWNIDGKKPATEDSVIRQLENADIKLHITDKRGCMATSSAIIRAPRHLRLDYTSLDPSYQSSTWRQKANEANDGKIELFADGGTAPYRYLWDNGSDKRLLEKLDSGTYRVTVTDSNGCRLAQEIQLKRTPSLYTELRLLNEPSCADSQTAAFNLSVQGGRQPYTFDWYKNSKWIGNDSILTKTNMGAGIYKIFIRDAHGVVSCDSLHVHEPERISIMAKIEDATAWTLSNGSIQLYVSGGTPPYRIFWNNGMQTETIKHLKRGLYKADIYDFNHCHTSVSYALNSPDSLMISSIAVQHYKEKNTSGFIKLSVQGGVKPYRYHWGNASGQIILADSGNQNLMELDGLMPGIYRFYLSDAGGAIIEQLFEIEENRKLEATLLLESPVYCNGENSAVVQAWIRGGKEPYTYIWSGIPDSLQHMVEENAGITRIEGLPAGEYHLQVYDVNSDSCSVSLTVTQPEPLSLSAGIYPAEDSSNTDGIFVLRVQGGCPPYRYLWNTGNEQSRQEFLRESHYHAIVTDAEGCTVSIDLDSVMSANLQVNLQQTAGIRCFGEQTAAIEINIMNGKPPFDIQWSNGENTSGIKGLSAGKYTVTVTDALGRIDSGSMMIRQPEKLQNHITIQEPACHGFSNGSIQLQTTGGNGYYTYAWNTGEHTPNRSQLSQGTYIVQVTDRLQCTHTDTITLNEPVSLQCILLVDSIICPDEKGRIAWSADGGTPPYRHKWSVQNLKDNGNNIEHEGNPLIELADAGRYRLYIIDSNNCQLDTSVTLANPKVPAYTLEHERSLCAGQVLNLKADGCDTIPNLQYLWIYPDGKTSEHIQISTDMAGMHQLTIIQNRQCIYHDSVNVTPFPDSIHVEFWVSSRITANQSCLLVNLSGYMPDSTQWHIPENVRILNNEGSYLEIQFPGSGLYTVGLTSFKGLCSESVFRQIEVFDEQDKSQRESNRNSVRWSIAPNPTRNNCVLSGNSEQPYSVHYRLVQASTGKISEHGTFKLPKNARTARTVFSGNETAGMYILILEYGNERHSFKIIKL